ncbi:MAG: hypothetical protein ACLTTU_15895, partial [Bilophila wadsworthia]
CDYILNGVDLFIELFHFFLKKFCWKNREALPEVPRTRSTCSGNTLSRATRGNCATSSSGRPSCAATGTS